MNIDSKKSFTNLFELVIQSRDKLKSLKYSHDTDKVILEWTYLSGKSAFVSKSSSDEFIQEAYQEIIDNIKE